MYEITVERVFAASHAIRLPDGTLEPVHGHNWTARVTVASRRLDAIETVMDFHPLEQSLETIVMPWHNRHLNQLPPFAGAKGGLKVNPTAERVAWWIGTRIARGLPKGVKMVCASVSEAPGCTATYRP